MSDDFYLKICRERSILFEDNKEQQIFEEGPSSKDAVNRYAKIKEALKNGFLMDLINDCRNHPSAGPENLPEQYRLHIGILVDSVTSEVGRALVGLSVLQLTVKAIDSQQNIRLHKGSKNQNTFSWQEGISMRVLDKNYVTPTLRKFDLLRLNADGFMMTRSLAENYPYTALYKAKLRGARFEWLEIVEGLEKNEFQAIDGLKFLIMQLLNKSEDFNHACDKALKRLDHIKSTRKLDISDVTRFVVQHMQISDYAARLMEIGMHSFMQAVEETNFLGSRTLVKLSQMRSANKKHGNIGDIEIREDGEIYASWDAKYGKTYLRDEIEELTEKLGLHKEVALVGFVTTEPATKMDELATRISDIEQTWNISLTIQEFDSWIEEQAKDAIDSDLTSENELAEKWITAYVESICQLRREKAPIDEPCLKWVQEITKLLADL